jgi:hypothetical protein
MLRFRVPVFGFRGLSKASIASTALLVLATALTSQTAQAQTNNFYQVTGGGLVSSLNVSNIASPASQYQIQTVLNGINGASYDPIANRLYYIQNLSGGTQSQLWYLQFDSNGGVLSENVVRTLPGAIGFSYGADYYNGRIWISNNTNVLYGFSTSNFSLAPTTLTLPVSPNNSSTVFNLGDITFDDANQILYVAGSHTFNQESPSFVYKYDVSNLAAPSLLASRDYTPAAGNPFFNGIAFNDATSILYGYSASTGSLYTINQSSLTFNSTVGTNPQLSAQGDLAGFTAATQVSVATPEPGSVALILPVFAMAGMVIRKRRQKN